MDKLQKFFPVDESLKTKILASYNKTEKALKEDVLLIRKWLQKQPHLPEIKSDRFLEIMLMRNKCRIEKAKIKIDKYFAGKSAFPDIFAQFDPERDALKVIHDLTTIAFMPKPNPNDGARVFYRKCCKDENTQYSFKEFMYYQCLLNELRLWNDYSASEIAIYDLKHVGLSYIKGIDVAALSKASKIFTECFSGSLKAIHLINIARYHDVLLVIIKAALPTKLYLKVKIHKTLEDLYKDVPKDLLPIEICGTSGVSGKELQNEFYNCLLNHQEAFLKYGKMKTDELLRQGEPIFTSDLFGMDGTFKTINLD